MNLYNSKICIITTRNIFDAPCLAKYQSLIKRPYDIIYWDRCNIKEECGATNYYRYVLNMESNSGKTKKITAYLRFFLFVNKILKKNKYDLLVIFPTQAGWLIQKKLCNEYKGRYIFDIRDYAGEKNIIFSYMTKKVIAASGLCSITSPAYQSFLPQKNYLISNNIQFIEPEVINKYRERKDRLEEPINLSFIGSVRFIDKQKKLLNIFKNDTRFHINYIGSGSEQLKQFCKEQSIKNVTLVGRFKRDDISNFYMNTDMAINVYGNNDPYLDYALSNKLYSAAMMGMPILVSTGTYMAEIAEKNGFGCCVDLDDLSTPDKVYSFYHSLDCKKMYTACDVFMDSILQEETIYTNAVTSYIRDLVRE